MKNNKLNLEDIRYIFNIIIPTWNHKLVKTKWDELKSKYTDDEIVRVLNENKEYEIKTGELVEKVKEFVDQNPVLYAQD